MSNLKSHSGGKSNAIIASVLGAAAVQDRAAAPPMPTVAPAYSWSRQEKATWHNLVERSGVSPEAARRFVLNARKISAP